MRMIVILILLLNWISLTACSSMSGNVVPQKGPAMEEVYDSMDQDNESNENQETKENKGNKIHRSILTEHVNTSIKSNNTFHKVANPELKMYIFPHLAGSEEVPIPGYYTMFNAYPRDHYALSDVI